MELKYQLISLNKLLEAYDEDEKVKEILNSFECINNIDVEKFLHTHNKAVHQNGNSALNIVAHSN